jgi:hypothetical protein
MLKGDLTAGKSGGILRRGEKYANRIHTTSFKPPVLPAGTADGRIR